MYALEWREYLSIENAAWRYILCYKENDFDVIELHDISYMKTCVTGEIITLPDSAQTQITMKISFDGKPETEAGMQQFTSERWKPVFRYYRFSCLSHNLYDAYRWMYLVFEQLLQMVEPIKRNSENKICEKEKTWLQRALQTLEERFRVFRNLYGEMDSHILIDRFMREQYVETRCCLFHAKDWVIVPNDELEQTQLQQRYEELKRVCSSVLTALGFLKTPYGVMTCIGFKKSMEAGWEDNRGFLCNQKQECLIGESQERPLPEGRLTIEPLETKEIRPGMVDMSYVQDYLKCMGGQNYLSYGIESENFPMVIGELPLPLSFAGDVRVKVHLVTQMVNKGEVVIG